MLKVAAVVLLLAAVGGGGYWYYAGTNKAGRIEVAMVPADATVLIDNAKVGDHSPLSIERPPGAVHAVGHARGLRAQRSEHRGARRPAAAARRSTLEPSPDTGFELTSEPPGGLVWLDGAAIRGAAGQQARTDFRAFRIAPGHHVLEIKGENRFKPWRQDIDVEPGAIAKVHAMLIPASGSAPAGKSPPRAGGGAGAAAAHAAAARARAAPPPAAKPTPPPSSRRGRRRAAAGSATPPPAAPHTPRHKKSHEVALDDGAGAGPPTPPTTTARAAPKASDKGDRAATARSPWTRVPWSEVWIDGKNTSQHTPIVDYKIPCGRHKLAFKRPDMQIDQTESITVKPGQKFKQRYTLATDE